MARFRRRRAGRRSFRGGMRSFGRRAGRAGSRGFDVLKAAGWGAVYGFLRNPIAQAEAPLTAKLPFGQFNDEAGMLITAGLTHAFIRNPISDKLTIGAGFAEGVSIGANMSAGWGFGGSNNGQGFNPTIG